MDTLHRTGGEIRPGRPIGSNTSDELYNRGLHAPTQHGIKETMTTSTKNDVTELLRNSNQALGIGEYAVAFLDADREGGSPDQKVLERTMLFFTDSILCGVSALALGTNAPRVLRDEALGYPDSEGVPVLGSTEPVSPEKAILANCSAVREWDSNGTNFGYRPELGHTAGEFGHNDFYCVAVAAAQIAGRGQRPRAVGVARAHRPASAVLAAV